MTARMRSESPYHARRLRHGAEHPRGAPDVRGACLRRDGTARECGNGRPAATEDSKETPQGNRTGKNLPMSWIAPPSGRQFTGGGISTFFFWRRHRIQNFAEPIEQTGSLQDIAQKQKAFPGIRMARQNQQGLAQFRISLKPSAPSTIQRSSRFSTARKSEITPHDILRDHPPDVPDGL